jgi:Zn-dependent peptidase ImmA (M78 family)
VFINGAGAKPEQVFTLGHALAHIWLGQSALSDVTPITAPEHHVERWCSQVAAELFVPLDDLRTEYRHVEELRDAFSRLARRFKVSTRIILRRIHDLRGLRQDELREAYERERLGRRFSHALVTSTLEGETVHQDAFRLLGFSKLATLREFGNRLRMS